MRTLKHEGISATNMPLIALCLTGYYPYSRGESSKINKTCYKLNPVLDFKDQNHLAAAMVNVTKITDTDRLSKKDAATLSASILKKALLIGCLLTSSGSAYAFSFGDIANTITSTASFFSDPLKLGASSGNILESVKQIRDAIGPISDLEATTNQNLKDRLTQVNDLLTVAQADIEKDMNHADEIIQRTAAQLKVLETDIFDRSESLVEQVRCVGVDWSNVQLRNALKEAAASLAEAHPGISLLGFRIVSVDVDKVQVANAYDAYVSIRKQYLKDLNNLSQNASVDFVHSAYANIQKSARDTICIYRGDGVTKDLYRQHAFYMHLENRWTDISQ